MHFWLKINMQCLTKAFNTTLLSKLFYNSFFRTGMPNKCSSDQKQMPLDHIIVPYSIMHLIKDPQNTVYVYKKIYSFYIHKYMFHFGLII